MIHLGVFLFLALLGWYINVTGRKFYSSVMAFVIWAVGFIGAIVSALLLFLLSNLEN